MRFSEIETNFDPTETFFFFLSLNFFGFFCRNILFLNFLFLVFVYYIAVKLCAVRAEKVRAQLHKQKKKQMGGSDASAMGC